MISTRISYLVIALLSLTVDIYCQSCEYTSEYRSCSTNAECGCLQRSSNDSIGVCGLTSASCSQFAQCQSPSDTCEQAEHICVLHPACDFRPVCYPLSMTDQRLCPPIEAMNSTRPSTTIASSYLSELTMEDGTYVRPGGTSGNYYYESIEIVVGTSGYYNLTSLSRLDTHRFLYNGTFDPYNPSINLVARDDDAGGNSQFKLTPYLEAGVPYTLVVSTHSSNQFGQFSVVGSGPDNVYFIPKNVTETTTTTSTSTRPSIINTNYSSALTLTSSSFDRKDNVSSIYYYEALQVNVNTTGNYTFMSSSGMDTYGYIYQGNFYPFYPSFNIHAQDDDSGNTSRQFKLTASLRSDITYILVFTTFGQRVTGSFSVVASGPDDVTLIPVRNNSI